ncbi:uncharacterized protein [Antedon mediterranea]|uniref:uncharacterized protein n=1 Tax=Antedon mediterranea TaxID=105859 RepID=UPI003AF49531
MFLRLKKPLQTTVDDIHVKQKVINIIATFNPEDCFATCTAEGHPKPSSVLILQDGEMVKKGENTATIEINDEICQSNITCYVENGKLNDTTTLKNCKPKALPTDRPIGRPSDTPTGNLKDGLFPIDSTVLTVAIIIALILGSVPTWLTSRYIYQRRLREIRSNCQNLQYQELTFPSHSGVSNELNTLGHMVDPKSRQNTYRPIPMEREEIEIQCQNAEVLYEEPHVVTSTLNKGKVTEAHYCGQFYD